MPIHPHTRQYRSLRRAVGRRVLEERRRRNMTLKILSRKSGFSPEFLDSFEMGRGMCRLDELARIAAALGVPLNCLIRAG